MGISESQRVCKDHPNHDQRLGVCASCLRDKLSQLYVLPSTYDTKTAASSAYSSYSSSARTSPGHRGHQRNGSDFMMGGSSILSFRISFGVGLKKSKSIAVVPTSGNKIKTTKKKGFWSKMKIPTKILL